MIIDKKQINIREFAKIWSKFLFDSSVFYVPVLGPVYAINNIEKILFEVLKNSKSHKFLSYDKNKRWFSEKTENIVLSKIYFNNEEVIVPVIDSFNKACKFFYYSNNPLNKTSLILAKKIFKEISAENKIQKLFFYCYQKPKFNKKFITHNIYLKKINQKDKLSISNEKIFYFHNLPNNIKKTFKQLGRDRELNNFNFLWKEFILKNKKLSTMLCAITNKRIIGAIGPLDIKKDVYGIPFLLPPNFGVLENERGRGIGENLWKEAMNYAFRKKAKYTLVQNVPDSPAAKFYESQGLLNMNSVYLIKL
jgi:hypothetical protein